MKNNNRLKLLVLFVVAISMILSACSRNTIDTTDNDRQQIDVVQTTDTQQEANSEKNTVSSETNEKYNEFLEKAEAIERYSKENYETATTQTELNTESYNVYVKWDSLLNEVYQYLKNTMNSNEFSALEAEEVAWIKEKEKGVEEAATEWEGGSGEPMARNSAGIKYTSERCHYLISLVQQCK